MEVARDEDEAKIIPTEISLEVTSELKTAIIIIGFCSAFCSRAKSYNVRKKGGVMRCWFGLTMMIFGFMFFVFGKFDGQYFDLHYIFTVDQLKGLASKST
jgi:hypothetical protein